MPASGAPLFRAGGVTRAIAGLHVDSWRRHYRGAYSDAFLDGDVDDFMLGLWTRRLSPPRPPGDDPANLHGKPMALRCVWPDLSELAGRCDDSLLGSG